MDNATKIEYALSNIEARIDAQRIYYVRYGVTKAAEYMQRALDDLNLVRDEIERLREQITELEVERAIDGLVYAGASDLAATQAYPGTFIGGTQFAHSLGINYPVDPSPDTYSEGVEAGESAWLGAAPYGEVDEDPEPEEALPDVQGIPVELEIRLVDRLDRLGDDGSDESERSVVLRTLLPAGSTADDVLDLVDELIHSVAGD